MKSEEGGAGLDSYTHGLLVRLQFWVEALLVVCGAIFSVCRRIWWLALAALTRPGVQGVRHFKSDEESTTRTTARIPSGRPYVNGKMASCWTAT